jgi:hypothetical protein
MMTYIDYWLKGECDSWTAIFETRQQSKPPEIHEMMNIGMYLYLCALVFLDFGLRW